MKEKIEKLKQEHEELQRLAQERGDNEDYHLHEGWIDACNWMLQELVK